MVPGWTKDVDDTNCVRTVHVAAIRFSRLRALEFLYLLLYLFRTFFVEALLVGREFVQ